MDDYYIVKMYKKGFSIDYIAKRYNKYLNKDKKPLKIGNELYFPPKIYDMKYCRLYVAEVIYKYLQKGYTTQTIA